MCLFLFISGFGLISSSFDWFEQLHFLGVVSSWEAVYLESFQLGCRGTEGLLTSVACGFVLVFRFLFSSLSPRFSDVFWCVLPRLAPLSVLRP